MSKQAVATARRFIEEQDRLGGGPAEELCAGDYVAYLASFPPMDLRAHSQFSAAFYAGFPDLKHTVEDVLSDDDRVALRLRITGTNTADFMGMPATGKAVVVDALALMTIADGKVRELRGQFDQMGLMQQLGVPAAS